jgi:hypothetical protein
MTDPPAARHARPPPGEEPTFGFHQDTGRVNKELETSRGGAEIISVEALGPMPTQFWNAKYLK